MVVVKNYSNYRLTKFSFMFDDSRLISLFAWVTSLELTFLETKYPAVKSKETKIVAA